MLDNRNVLDEFKGMSHDSIVNALDDRGVELEVAIENSLRDFNMGSIVRSANAFGVRKVHVIGRRQWNKRGAMMTDKYLQLQYHSSVEVFVQQMKQERRTIVALENNVRSSSLYEASLHRKTVIVFGQEGPGISAEMLQAADHVLHIPQLGSTRSLNVGVAAGIALYEWSKQHQR